MKYNQIPKNNRIIDLTGDIYGRYKVLGYDGKYGKTEKWFCKCKCGNIKSVQSGHLRNGHSKSCGCLAIENTIKVNTTHGMSKSKEFTSYEAAKNRCNNKKHPAYKDYGGRGIKFNFKNFQEFYTEIGDKPTVQHTVDRIDSNGNYQQGNIKWATRTEQANNRRTNVFYEYKSQSLTLSEISRITGINRTTMSCRLKRGWSLNKTFGLIL